MWDFFLKLQDVFIWVFIASLVLLFLILCFAAYIGAKNRPPRDNRDDDETP